MAKKISQEIKDKIVDKIKSEGLSVAQAAREFGVKERYWPTRSRLR